MARRKTLMARYPKLLLILAAGVALSAGAIGAAGTTRSPAENWHVAVVTDDLDYPWDIEMAGGTLVLTEKAGNVVVVDNGDVRRYELETEQPIRTDGGAGLLGLALAPNFPESGRAFFYQSYTKGTEPANRVIEAHFGGETWRERRVLLGGIPGHRLYNGGRIAIGPDGHLYVTTGWTENYERPQDVDNLAGKILRMTLDGEVPPDNPFEGSFVYSYGHRNPQGIAWNSAGELFSAEHGQSARDEINQIRPGADYGWPVISGEETKDGMETPLLSSGRTTWAPSGVAFAGDRLLVAALRGEGLYALDDEAGELDLVFTSNERIRQVLPEGETLYIITTNRSPRREGISDDRLLRLSPSRE